MWMLRIDDTITPESNGKANGFFDVVESASPIGVDSLTGSFCRGEEGSGPRVHGQRPLIGLPRLRRLLSDCRSRFGRRRRLGVRLS
jgi:hypothetical protein